MSKLFFYIFLLVCINAEARDYYFSVSGSDAGSGTQAAPFQSLNKLNTLLASADPGDRFFLKRGDTWYGSITISRSGTQDQPITLGAYGKGTLPVISGFTTLSKQAANWTKVGSNIYETSVPDGLASNLNMCLVNGKIQPMGRYPNYTVFGGSWLRWEDHEADSAITDKNLSTAINWTGAQAVVRCTDNIMDTATILTHSSSSGGSRLSFSSDKIYNKGVQSANIMDNGYGYFIQNDPRTLDRNGEWFYNKDTKIFRIYLTAQPANYTIKVASIHRGVIINNGADWIVVNAIRLEGFNTDAIALLRATPTDGCNNNTIKNCEMQWCRTAVTHDDGTSAGTSCIANKAYDITHVAFYGRNTKNFTVRENEIKRVGLWPGMGTANQGCMAIWGVQSNGNYSLNKIDSVGWSGIRVNGNNVHVDSNYISNYAMIMNDAGGVYFGNTDADFSNRYVRSNVIMNGWGNIFGTNQETNTAPAYRSYGIYMDDFANHVEIANNVVAGTRDAAFLLHNTWALNIHDNLFVGGGRQVGYISSTTPKIDDNPERYGMHDMKFKNNSLVAKNSGELIWKIWNRMDSSNYRRMTGDNAPDAGTTPFDNWNDNIYVHPGSQDGTTISTTWKHGTKGSTMRNYNNAQWTKAFGLDTRIKNDPKLSSSKASPGNAFFFYYNPALKDSTITLTRSLIDINGNIHAAGEQFTMPPLSGIMFLPGQASGKFQGNAGNVLHKPREGNRNKKSNKKVLN